MGVSKISLLSSLVHDSKITMLLYVALLCALGLHLALGQDQPITVPISSDGETCGTGENPKVDEVFDILYDQFNISTPPPIPIFDCGGTPGWRRVAYINMTDPSTQCPEGLMLTTYSRRTCGRSNVNPGCSGTVFAVDGPFSRVCGRLRGYQVGACSGFFGYLQQNQRTIDGYYVEGVSLTHGAAGSRQHIWTFAVGLSETVRSFPRESCPCDTPFGSPPFVGNEYFCESGINGPWPGSSAFGRIYPDDTLWDGQDCLPSSTCCQFNNPPWFTKTLPSSTTDDIELRVCSRDQIRFDDTALELIELYVQ